MRGILKCLGVAAIALAVALLWLYIRAESREAPAEDGRPSASGAVRLQTPSSRGTVPWVVGTSRVPTKEVRGFIESKGAKVVGVLPHHVLMVEAGDPAVRSLKEAGRIVKSVVELKPSRKVSRRLAALLASGAGTVDVTIVPLSKQDCGMLKSFVLANGGETVTGMPGNGRLVRASMPAELVGRLVTRGDVRWIEPFSRPRLLNDVAAGIAGVRETWDTHGLTGSGQIVTTSDTGLDTGSIGTLMADFSGRVCEIKQGQRNCRTADVHGHGTHTAGSIAGSGALSGGQIKGMAYEARLYVWACLAPDGNLYFPSTYDSLFAPSKRRYPAYIHSASWGGDSDTWCLYDADCAEIDEYLWTHPEMLGVFAAGNSGADSIAAPAGAKNVLAVGATQNYRPDVFASDSANIAAVAWYSSRGPMLDGRIKPDVCAPGSGILSTRTSQISYTNTVGWESYTVNSNYTYDGGTSMATPIVAGSAALVRQWLVERRGCTNGPPTASLMKAIITGGAHDMSADASARCGGAAPNGVQGWGRLEIAETLYPSNRSVRLYDRIPFADGRTWLIRVAVTNESPLEVQLAWTDYPGAPESYEDPALVNDLDLTVRHESTGETWRGNGVPGGDRLNNLEGVRIASAPPGVYDVMVTGHDVAYDSGEGGAAALYLRGAFADGDPPPEGLIFKVH